MPVAILPQLLQIAHALDVLAVMQDLLHVFAELDPLVLIAVLLHMDVLPGPEGLQHLDVVENVTYVVVQQGLLLCLLAFRLIRLGLSQESIAL